MKRKGYLIESESVAELQALVKTLNGMGFRNSEDGVKNRKFYHMILDSKRNFVIGVNLTGPEKTMVTKMVNLRTKMIR